jgi:nucleotide-binding universal stress UspA family protein
VAGTILCGVNESAGAREAAAVACALGEQLELRLVLVHIADGFTGADGSVGDDVSLTTMQAKAEGERLLKELAVEQGFQGIERRIEVGDPVERLVQVAAEERAALILLGARAQRRGWRPSLRSDLSRELVRVTTCPVLVVPPATRNHVIREPLVLTVR